MKWYMVQHEYPLAKSDAQQYTALGPTEGTVLNISRV